jgi:hypothetical protein
MHGFVLAGAVALAFLFSGAAARAATNVTFVSATGSDANTCGSASVACLTFARALTQTTAGGSIVVLTPGSYGPLTIDKAVTIFGNGMAIINSSTGSPVSGIVVAAGASDIVTIRGVSITLRQTAANGISLTSGAALHVEDCLIEGAGGGSAKNGIHFAPAADAELFVSNTTISNSSNRGLNIIPSGGTARATIRRLRSVSNGGVGIVLNSTTAGNIRATISDSVTSENGSGGFTAATVSTGSITAMVDRLMVSNNNTNGVSVAGGNALVRMRDSTITGNPTGVIVSGGRFENLGSNTFAGNNDDPVEVLRARR